jgi:hypothetical protein
LGIGAAVASTPGIASADPFSFDPNDIAISFDGTSLLQEGTATAHSGTAGEFNFAFADGAHADALATDGTGNVAEADGTGALAFAEGGNSDTAIDIGNNSGLEDGAFAGQGFFGGTGSNDFAYILGDNGNAFAGGNEGDSGPLDGSNDIAAIVGANSATSVGADDSTPGDFDLGAVFGDGLDSEAAGANYLVSIVPDVAGLDSALSTLLADIASLF